MGKSLLLDLRERVLAFIKDGHSCREAARRFMISAARTARIRQRYRTTGTFAAAKRGRPLGSGRLEPLAEHIHRQIKETAGLTMPELVECLLTIHGLRAAPAGLSRFCKHRLGLTYKKIPDRNRKAARSGTGCAARVASPPDPKDAP